MLVLLASVFASLVVANRARQERDLARAEVAKTRQEAQALQKANSTLRATNKQLNDAYQGQVGLDKSHLLDCWSVIVRLLPRTGPGNNSMRSIFGTSDLSSLIGIARTRFGLPHYVRRCASAVA